MARIVGFTIEGPFDESRVERILRRAEAEGVVAKGQWGTGRGQVCWFNGSPGAELRKVRDQIRAMVTGRR